MDEVWFSAAEQQKLEEASKPGASAQQFLIHRHASASILKGHQKIGERTWFASQSKNDWSGIGKDLYAFMRLDERRIPHEALRPLVLYPAGIPCDFIEDLCRVKLDMWQQDFAIQQLLSFLWNGSGMHSPPQTIVRQGCRIQVCMHCNHRRTRLW